MNPNCPDHQDCCPWKTVAQSRHHYRDREVAFQNIRAYGCREVMLEVISAWGAALGQSEPFGKDNLALLGASGQPEAAGFLLRAKTIYLPAVLRALLALGEPGRPALKNCLHNADEQPDAAALAALVLGILSASCFCQPTLSLLEEKLKARSDRVRMAVSKSLTLLAGSPHYRGWETWEYISGASLLRLAVMSDAEASPNPLVRAYAAEALCAVAGSDAIPLAARRGGYAEVYHPVLRRIVSRPPLGEFALLPPSPDPNPAVREVWNYWWRAWQQDDVPVNWLAWDGLHLQALTA